MRLVWAILTCAAALAQSPAAFDVVSIKPQPWTGQGRFGVMVRGDTLDGQHVSLNDLVAFAYNLQGFQLSGGPAWAERQDWASSELYQVTAKVSANPPPSIDVFRTMLQPVLADRFHLQVHRVQKNFPVYDLVIAKGGPKLKASAADAASEFSIFGRGAYGIHMEAVKVSVPRLVETQLSGYSLRPIIEKTGLTADYDFTLDFVSERAPLGRDDSSRFPSLVTAVQDQLGLKLEPSTAPFDTIVVDHAEHPSSN